MSRLIYITKLLEQAIVRLKTRPISEQDSISIDPKWELELSIEFTREYTRSIKMKLDQINYA